MDFLATTMPAAPLQFAHCELDTDRRNLRVNGVSTAIEPRPYDLLVHLIGQRHRVVSRQELLEKVWPGRSVSSSALERAVMKLRRSLGDASHAPLIRTVQRVGYRFVASVSGDEAQLPGRVIDICPR